MLKRKLKEEKGIALAFVIVALVFVFLMVSIVAMLANTNVKQASAQEKGLQAYYIARSGAELAYEAIMTTNLLDQLSNDKDKVLQENNIDFDEGTADVIVNSEEDEELSEQMIVIKSVGTLKESGISRSVTLKFYVKYETYPDILWSK